MKATDQILTRQTPYGVVVLVAAGASIGRNSWRNMRARRRMK